MRWWPFTIEVSGVYLMNALHKFNLIIQKENLKGTYISFTYLKNLCFVFPLHDLLFVTSQQIVLEEILYLRFHTMIYYTQ